MNFVGFHSPSPLRAVARNAPPILRRPLVCTASASKPTPTPSTSHSLAPPTSSAGSTSKLDPSPLRARDRRRAAKAAHRAAHRAVAAARENNDARVYVAVPSEHRARAGLSARLARVKVFVPVDSLAREQSLRAALREGVVALFPEVATRGGAADDGDVDVAIGNVKIERGDDGALVKAMERFGFDFGAVREEGSEKLTDIYAELLLRDLPPLPPAPSERRLRSRNAAEEAEKSSSLLRMVSFYKLTHFQQPHIVADRIAKIWKDLGIFGRVYVAEEGINAQLAVPVPLWGDFQDAMTGAWPERDVASELIGVYLNVDGDVSRGMAPFTKLHVRLRDKVLADGLEEPLDWTRAGTEVAPSAWHEMLTKAKEKDASERPILLDCRNDYETNVGQFRDAEPVGTSSFRDTWGWLESRLKGVSPSTPILTYCTGGIRCAKVNAYLEQKMGFDNTSRLAGGIVSYAKELRDQDRLHESEFIGTNFVFDGRVGEAITDDLLGRCHNCGTPCSIQTDCSNAQCPRPFDTRLFVQCPDCATRLIGACCEECRTVVANAGGATAPASSFSPEKNLQSQANTSLASSARNALFEDRRHDDAYSTAMSEAEPPLLAELRAETDAKFKSRAHMVGGPLVAPLLGMLVALTNAKRVLEIGTFTGYSTLTLARALGNRNEGGVVVTCEVDEEVAAFAASYFARDKDCGDTIDLRLGRALETIQAAKDKGEPPFDLVFMDADKKYSEYYELLMGGMLRVGGLLVVDNVLFRGQVSSQWAQSASDESSTGSMSDAEMVQNSVLASRRLKSLENVRKIARSIHSFNSIVVDDPRAETVMLPVRDGISLIRRRA